MASGGIGHVEFLAVSTRIRGFEAVRRGICRHLRWPYELPTASMDEEGEEMIWLVLSSTCEACDWAFVSLPKATYLAWKDFIPLRCTHAGELWDFKVKPGRKPSGARVVCLSHSLEPLIPQLGLPFPRGDITIGILQHYMESMRL